MLSPASAHPTAATGASSPERSPPRPVGRWIWGNVFLLLLTQASLAFAVPVFAAMFADFGSPLPRLTQLVFDWQEQAERFRCLDPVRAVLFTMVAGGALRGVSPRSWLRLAVVLQTLVLVLLGLALTLPVFQLGAVAAGLN